MSAKVFSCIMIICTQPPTPQSTRECEVKDQSIYALMMIEDKKRPGTFVPKDDRPVRLQSGATITWRCAQ